MSRAVRWACGVGVLLVLAFMASVIVKPELYWDPNGAAIAESLDDEGGAAFGVPGRCRRHGEAWECVIEQDPGSGGSGSVTLILEEDDCWIARGLPYRRPISGCLDAFDYLGI